MRGVSPMSKRRLKTLSDVRRYISSLINRAESGDIEPSVATKLCYLANSLSKVIETSDLEKRLSDLEAKVENKYGR
jgi:hypothetical protein